MSWSTTQIAIAAARIALSDGPTDKLVSDKKVLGTHNGVNLRFKTFERRRVTNFTVAPSAGSPEGVYLGGVLIATSGFTADDPLSGSFVLNGTPIADDGKELVATYYHQYFLDAELDNFLMNAAGFMSIGTDYTQIPNGLVPAALAHVKYQAYDFLADWFLRSASEAYMLEDAPGEKKNVGTVQAYAARAKSSLTLATTLRDDFYKRQGQAGAPIWGNAGGRVREIVPPR